MSASRPLVTVVVSTHNRAGRLERLLATLRAQTLDSGEFEVVVIDDGSTDETAAVLESASAGGQLSLRSIRNDAALGAAAARDRGWRLARAPLIAFTDDDCEPAPGWLAAGLRESSRNPGGFIQGRTLPNPNETDRLGPFSRTIEISRLDLNFNTCNIFYPRELLERLDGFDIEAFGRGSAGEDSDLAWRAIARGAKPAFCFDALVHHAVNQLGPLGKLRVAGRSMDGYARHPELRRATFVHGVFWKPEHEWLVLALAALAVPRQAWPIRLALLARYARNLWARGRVLGGGPLLAPYYLLHDLIEVQAVIRSGLRHRTPML